MERISWTGHVRHQEVSRRVKERNILHTIKLRRANWIGNILHMNCPLRHIIEGKTYGGTEATRKHGRRRKQLLDDLKERKSSGN